MALDRKTTLARIVLDHPECASVFLDRHVDFCCGAGVALAEACAAGGLDERDTLAALERALAEQGPPREDPRAMATPDGRVHRLA